MSTLGGEGGEGGIMSTSGVDDIMSTSGVFSTCGGYHDACGDIMSIVCTISFERPVNYLCDAWHVFPPKYEAWTHFNN